MLRKSLVAVIALVAAICAALAPPVSAGPRETRAAVRALVEDPPPLRDWMHGDVATAWSMGFFGQGTTITLVDDFNSTRRIFGTLGDGFGFARHGEWTRDQAGMLAPLADIRTQDFSDGAAVTEGAGLNVFNLSYAMIGPDGYRTTQIGWSAREASIIATARTGSGIVVKAAGNDGVAVGAATATGRKDYLNAALIGTRTTLFVGALDRNGSPDDPATLAGYSNRAGTDRRVQRRFVTVGVPGSETYLYGTSFAAPVVSGYAAILGSKFRRSSALHIVNRIVRTARTDTIADYDPALHGSGEASLARALAPLRIQ